MKEYMIIALLILAGCQAQVDDAKLNLDEVDAMNTMLQDEYKAEAIYAQVLVDHGDVRHFVNIIRAEQTHSARIENLFKSRGLDVPAMEEFTAPSFDSVQEACAAGVQAEIANAALYDLELAKVSDSEVISVFHALRDASQNNHLPAFERCS